MRYLASLLLLATALLLAGCESISTRARQHAATFNTLAPDVQQRLLAGEVALGDSPEMVEIAFGPPTDDRAILTTSGRVRRMWVYTTTKYMKEGSYLQNVNEQQNTAQVAEVYRVFRVLEREITFLDDAVVNVRDPARESPAIAAVQ